eukprot:6978098-Prymnesium_polylepis.3
MLSSPPLHLLSSSSPRKIEAVFSLQVKNDGLHVPRVDLRWEYLPSEASGVSVRELSLLAVDALKASTFSSSLEFVLGSDTVSALVPRMGSISNLQFKDFSFENSAVHTLLHGRWTASYVESKQCGETRCSI